MKKVMIMSAAAATGAVSVNLKNRLNTQNKAESDAQRNFRGYKEEEGACTGTEGEATRVDAKNIVLCRKKCNALDGCTAWEFDKDAKQCVLEKGNGVKGSGAGDGTCYIKEEVLA